MLIALLPMFVGSELGALTEGVRTVATPGLPGTVAVLDGRGMPFLAGREERALRPVAAASTLGRGRVVAFGHDGYLQAGALQTGDTRRLLTNALAWAAGRPTPRVGYFGRRRHEETLEALGLPKAEVKEGQFTGVDVLMVDGDAPTKGMIDFVRRGGGLVAANTGWGWMQLNPGKNLASEMPINGVLREAGLAIADGTAEAIRPVTDDTEADNLKASTALARLAKGQDGDAGLVLAALRATPAGSGTWKDVKRVIGKVGPVVPTKEKPIEAKDGLARLALAVHLYERPGGEGPADPAAADFPGLPTPRAKTGMVQVTVPVDREHWAGTGAYAAPGTEIEVEVPEALVGKNVQLQIGAHSDELWHLAKWERNPSIVVRKPISKRVTRLRSPFGGLVYVVVPGDLKLPAQRVGLQKVIPAGRYVTGATSLTEWQHQLDSGAPWAEFEAKNVIFTVPTTEARKVKDPATLVALWDRILDLYQELDGRPLPNRAERIVADRQISAGYMHSGYPIMTWLDDSVPLSLSVERLTTQGTWGHWHEIGHNHQLEAWTFDGTGEVTNNIYTLYMMDKVAGQKIWTRLGKEREKAKAYQASGAPFEKWQSDPFLALTMYAQLIDTFGWDACRQWFRSYEQGTLPKNEGEKRDQFLTRYSRVVGRNLSPFFVKWGVPTSEAARAGLRDLPEWSGPTE